MTTDQTMTVLQFFIKAFEQEQTITQKVLAALPDAGAGYKPDSKARTAIQLAHHLATSEAWFLSSIADGSFAWTGSDEIPPELSKPSAVAAWYLPATRAALEKVKKMTPEQSAKVLEFFGAFKLPAAAYMSFAMNHTVHHRGQLAAYIRAAGGKVPDIYGGSADEPWTGS